MKDTGRKGFMRDFSYIASGYLPTQKGVKDCNFEILQPRFSLPLFTRKYQLDSRICSTIILIAKLGVTLSNLKLELPLYCRCRLVLQGTLFLHPCPFWNGKVIKMSVPTSRHCIVTQHL